MARAPARLLKAERVWMQRIISDAPWNLGESFLGVSSSSAFARPTTCLGLDLKMELRLMGSWGVRQQPDPPSLQNQGSRNTHQPQHLSRSATVRRERERTERTERALQEERTREGKKKSDWLMVIVLAAARNWLRAKHHSYTTTSLHLALAPAMIDCCTANVAAV